MGKLDRYFVKYGQEAFSTLKRAEPELPTSGKPGQTVAPNFSPDQEAAYHSIQMWLKNRSSKLITLGGVAGSGKTRLTSILAGDLANKKVAFATLTGKASTVLRNKMRDMGVVSPRHTVSTIHSLIYQCFTHPESGRPVWKRKTKENFGNYDLVVLDEASMVSGEILEDIQSFGPRILAVGDHAQLPPVGGSASLMASPDLRLEKIHRQAMGNPILELSAIVREQGALPATLPGNGDERVRYIKRNEFIDWMTVAYKELPLEEVAALCWTNNVRTRLNSILRQIHFDAPDLGPEPREDDQVICLKNAYNVAFNGMRGRIKSIKPSKSEHFYEGQADFVEDSVRFRGSINRHVFGLDKGVQELSALEPMGLTAESWRDLGFLLDYGYCLTVHKAQGSQFHTVAYVYERNTGSTSDMKKRHIYTGITRAATRLWIVI